MDESRSFSQRGASTSLTGSAETPPFGSDLDFHRGVRSQIHPSGGRNPWVSKEACGWKSASCLPSVFDFPDVDDLTTATAVTWYHYPHYGIMRRTSTLLPSRRDPDFHRGSLIQTQPGSDELTRKGQLLIGIHRSRLLKTLDTMTPRANGHDGGDLGEMPDPGPPGITCVRSSSLPRMSMRG